MSGTDNNLRDVSLSLPRGKNFNLKKKFVLFSNGQLLSIEPSCCSCFASVNVELEGGGGQSAGFAAQFSANSLTFGRIVSPSAETGTRLGKPATAMWETFSFKHFCKQGKLCMHQLLTTLAYQVTLQNLDTPTFIHCAKFCNSVHARFGHLLYA